MQGPIDSAGTKQGRWGCLLCNASVDQAPIDPQTETHVIASMSRIQMAIETVLKDLPDYARAPRKRETKAAALLAGYFGLRVLVKAGFTRQQISDAAQDLLNF